jgi:hypothetical protein
MKRTALAAFILVVLAGCGATVGDPCTTANDCGSNLCINSDLTPGGYCSRQCTLADDKTCPGGTTCIRDGLSKDVNACFKICVTQNECRTGYVCKALRDNTNTVCVAP